MGAQDPYQLVHRLSCLDLRDPPDKRPVRTADDLLLALVAGSDHQGRYFAEPELLCRLFWWDRKHPEIVQGWLAELVACGDVRVDRNAAENCYGGTHDIVSVLRRGRFPRWETHRTRRPAIPATLRAAIYERDGHRCVACSTTTDLTLDHSVPFSLGGSDDPGNLQTMCRSCNSKKGARV